MSITVADEGNRRVGGASPEELRQCVLGISAIGLIAEIIVFMPALVADIKSWFKRKTSLRLNEGAAPEDFQRLRKAVDQSIPEVQPFTL